MKLNNIYKTLLLSALAMPFMASCDSDTDSNPTFHEAETFVLNESAYAANNTINLAASGTVVSLTCSQPDYGFPIATIYTVQLSFESSFDDGTYAEMSTTFTDTSIDIDADEMNSTLLDLWESLYEDEDVPTDPVAVYVRLTAYVSGQSIGNSTSNVICLPSVLMTTTVTTVDLPATMYLAGSHNGWTFMPMGVVYGLEGQYYTVIYMEDGGQFKFGTKDQEWLGYTDSRLEITNNTSSDVNGDNDDSNIQFGTGGWYTIYFKVTVSGGDYKFAMTISDAAVYVISPTADSAWAISSTWQFTDNGDGTLISPALDASGELRMAIDCGYDWWRTEFTLKDGSEIYYRDVDISSNWAENVGSEYSVTVASGDVVVLDFNSGTGYVK